jgi:hypothetical protein
MELLERLPDLQTLDVRVERRIARVTVDNGPINLMDAALLEALDQLVRWLASKATASASSFFKAPSRTSSLRTWMSA